MHVFEVTEMGAIVQRGKPAALSTIVRSTQVKRYCQSVICKVQSLNKSIFSCDSVTFNGTLSLRSCLTEEEEADAQSWP